MTIERILVIDDEPNVIGLCQRALKKQGFAVEGALSGEEGLQLLKEEGFDLILLDLKLPDHDGTDMLYTIREMDQEVAVVIITGHGTMEAAIRAVKSGAQDFLLKPFTPEELTTSVQGVLERKRLTQENLRLKARLPILEISKALVSEVNLERLAQLALQTVQQELGADQISLMLLDEERQELFISAALGLPDEMVATTRVKVGQGLAGLTAQRREPLLVSEQAERDPAIQALLTRSDVGSAICVPLMLKDRVLGVLNARRPLGGDPFRQDDVDLLSILGGQIAVAIENARLFEQAQKEIAERKWVEETLRRERDFAESLIETAQVIVLVLDTEGRIVRFNPYMEETSGYQLEEVQGKDWSTTFLPKRDRERIREVFSIAVSDIRTRGDVIPIVAKDGSERKIEWYSKTLKDAKGDVVGVLAVGQDITERVRAE